MGLFDKMKDAQQQAKDAMGNAGGVSGMMGGGDMTGQAAYAQLAQKLHAAGVEAPGMVNGINATGATDVGGGQMTEFDVTVTPPGGDPYQTKISQSMLPAQLEGLSVGGQITVKYDPDNPSAAMIFGW